VSRFCGACHAVPPADTFPRSAWKDEVERGYLFFQQSGMPLQAPPIEAVIQYYQERAPEELPPADIQRVDTPPPVQFERQDFSGPTHPELPAISNVNLVHLYDKRRLDVLATDMRRNQVMVLQPYAESPSWKVLAETSHPAHTELVDLDGDGIMDILVANLGSFKPTDDRKGSVTWLKGMPDGTFKPFTLLEGVGRVADVQAADFRGVGKLDLIVAVFGWHTTGEIVYLENQTTDWSKPKFVPRVLDDRHGGIHVPVVDLNGDGKPDFIALISQEHETVVAFLNEGGGKFRKEVLFSALHPAYGSSGIQVVDINNDGKVDVLYTNGDVLDRPYLLKPYHSVQWLENRGTFPWEHHPLTPMYGVHRAVAADFTGTGKKDIIATCFLPEDVFPQRKERNLDATIYLEQTEPGHFVRHTMEAITCDHVTCAAGDIYGTGRIDLVTGVFDNPGPNNHVLTIWKNKGLAARQPK
jgi:hypothetical protein